GRCPGQPDGHARLLGALLHFLLEESGRAEHLHDDLRGDLDGRLVALRATPRRLAAERADLALEVPDPCLAGVTANDLAERRRRETDVFGREPVVLHLLLDEMVGCNLELLLLGVSGDL